MKADNLKLPDWILNMHKNGFKSFYKEDGGKYFYYDISMQDYKKIDFGSNRITFSEFIENTQCN